MIPYATRRVTTILLEHASARGVCTLSHAEVAQLAGLHENTVWRIVALAKAAGLIETTGHAEGTLYRLKFTEPVDSFDPAPQWYWPDARVAQLKALRARGLSGGQIASTMGLSRGSVLGKLNRIKADGPAASDAVPSGSPGHNRLSDPAAY